MNLPGFAINILNKIRPYFLNRYTLILFVSTFIFLVVISNLNKYKCTLVSTAVSSEYYSHCYADLDQDGNSEKLQFISGYNDLFGLIVYHNEKIIEQWNFTGEKAASTSKLIEDFDDDGIKEIFIFTIHHDSVFLNCLDAMNRKIEFQNKAICKAIKDPGNEYDLNISPCSCYDVNHDGVKEIFFSIRSNFATHPRNMFAYYPLQDSVMVSPESCSLILEPEMIDLDGDSVPEFMAKLTHATGNCELSRKYSDQFCWLMVFTPEMKFKFPPVSFNAYPAVTKLIPIKTGAGYRILILHVYQGQENYPSFLAIFDITGKLIRRKILDPQESWVYSALFSNDENKSIYILKNYGCVFSIDSTLQLKYETKLESNPELLTISKTDIDFDNKEEFIIPGKSKGELLIYRNDFSNPVVLQTNYDISEDQISTIRRAGKSPEIFVNINDYLYTYSYKPILIYKFRYLLLIPIYLLVLFFYEMIRVIRKYRKLKTDHIQKQISELQIKSIQNQIDPHFIFNIFSSFSNLINERDTERANFIFDRYAGLLKASILNSENVRISLKEEIEFVASYLELERFRYSDKFSFAINLPENIDHTAPVPRMIVHIFVENAIKHGIRHLISEGRLIIDGAQHNGTIVLSIHDNGVGRAVAKEIGMVSTGKGLTIVDAIIENYNKLYNQKIGYVIHDLYENGRAAGTKVQIKIPIHDPNYLHNYRR